MTLVPNNNTVQGVFVADRSIGAPEYRVVDELIQFTLEKGGVVETTGVADAKNLKRYPRKLEGP